MIVIKAGEVPQLRVQTPVLTAHTSVLTGLAVLWGKFSINEQGSPASLSKIGAPLNMALEASRAPRAVVRHSLNAAQTTTLILSRYPVQNILRGRSRGRSMGSANTQTWVGRAPFILSSSLRPAPSTYKFAQEMLIYPKLCLRGAVVTQEFLSPPPAVLLAFFPESAKADSSGAKCEPVTQTSRNRELRPSLPGGCKAPTFALYASSCTS